MEAFLGGLLIFCLRLCDVSIGTVRTILVVQGRRLPVMCLAMLESTIWLLAVSRVLKEGINGDYWKVAGYAGGYALGTVLGMTVEKWLAFGKTLVRVISREHCQALRQQLLDRDFGVTAISGVGRDGEVLILFVVLKRRRFKELLSIIRATDPHAFITHEPVSDAIGGYLPTSSAPALGKA
jgi:uncharacterized protein YebE (UPF0316 family)